MLLSRCLLGPCEEPCFLNRTGELAGPGTACLTCGPFSYACPAGVGSSARQEESPGCLCLGGQGWTGDERAQEGESHRREPPFPRQPEWISPSSPRRARPGPMGLPGCRLVPSLGGSSFSCGFSSIHEAMASLERSAVGPGRHQA